MSKEHLTVSIKGKLFKNVKVLNFYLHNKFCLSNYIFFQINFLMVVKVCIFLCNKILYDIIILYSYFIIAPVIKFFFIT